MDGPDSNKADNLRTGLNYDRQCQLSVVSCPGFEPAIERQGSDNWENNFPVNSPDTAFKFPVPSRRELGQNSEEIQELIRRAKGRFGPDSRNFPVFSLLSFPKTQIPEATTIPTGQIWAVSSIFHGGGGFVRLTPIRLNL